MFVCPPGLPQQGRFPKPLDFLFLQGTGLEINYFEIYIEQGAFFNLFTQDEMNLAFEWKQHVVICVRD